MIHGYNDHFRSSQKHLFLGEEMRVFAERKDTDVLQQAQMPRSVAQAAQENDTPGIRQLKEAFSQLPESPDKHWKSWDPDVNVATAAHAYIRRLKVVKQHVRGKRFKGLDSAWKQKFTRIREGYSHLPNMQELGLNVNLTQLQDQEAEEFRAQRSAILKDLNALIGGLQKTRKEAMRRARQKMLEHFDTRIGDLVYQWEKKAPEPRKKDHYIHDLRALQRRLHANIGSLDDITDPHKQLKQLDKVSADLNWLAQRYRDFTEMEGYTFDVNQHRQKFKELEQLRAEKIEGAQARYNKMTGDAKAQLRALISAIESRNDIDPQQKEGVLKTFREELKKIEEVPFSEIAKEFNSHFYDTTPVPQPAEPDAKGGPKQPNVMRFYDPHNPDEFVDLTVPKGLQHQIELLNSDKLSPAQKKYFAKGLEDSLGRLEREIGQMETYLNQDLPKLLENLTEQQQRLAAPGPRGLDITVNWVAFATMPRLFETIGEHIKENYERRADGSLGAMGSELFKPVDGIPGIKNVSSKFRQKQEQAEQTAVNRYKEAYSNMDVWQIEARAYAAPDPDELKACLLLLAEKGRINWYDKRLLKQFNRFQSVVSFDTENIDAWLSEAAELNLKMERALGAIWDADTYKELRTQNSSQYDSKKSSYKAELLEIAQQPGGLRGKCLGILNRHTEARYNNKISQEDPIMYEQIIHLALEYGEFSTEDGLYFFIQGAAHGLLTLDRVSILSTSVINFSPVFEFFKQKTKRGDRPKLKDFQEWALIDGPPRNKKGAQAAFKEWFHRVPMMHSKVQDRIGKIISGGIRVDHDVVPTYIPHLSEGTIDQMLLMRSDGSSLEETAIRSTTATFQFQLDVFARNGNRQALKTLIASHVRWEAILGGNMHANQPSRYARWDADSLNKEPRYRGVSEGLFDRDQECATTRDYTNKTKHYISLIDPNIFKVMYSNSTPTPGQVRGLVAYIESQYGFTFEGQKPQNADSLYTSFGKFLDWLFENRPERVDRMIQAIKADHEVIFAKQGKDSLPKLQEKYAAEMQRFGMQEGSFEEITTQKASNNNANWTFAQQKAA